ncbi:PAS domain S-box protein [Azospirillum sp.]|uniref:PAS domain S-box protein n=1 Tax=Azospirillum sp. TaxID=34012 RepID=UPI002D72B327|nr:PAS domain S-box protein [Azospirillum sp.]HYD70225.1 PAS domain S-box protein [Azospirillum sp.]
MSLLTRLLVLVVLAMLPAVAVQVYNEHELRRGRRAEVVQQSGRLLGLIEGEQARLVEGIRQTLAAVAETPFVRAGDLLACQTYLERLKRTLPGYVEVYVADRAGHVGCATEAAALGVGLGDRHHVQEALRTNAFAVGEYVMSRTTGKPILPFALPSHDGAGALRGVVAAVLDVGWLEGYLRAKPFPADAAVTVADRNGVVAVRVPPLPGIVGQRLPERYQALLNAPAPGTTELVTLDGVTRVVAYSPLHVGPKGLFISVGLDEAAAVAPINAATLRSLSLVAAAFAFLLGAVAFGGNALLRRPVAALIEATRRWTEGDLSVRSGLRASTEVGALGQAFDAMADGLEAQVRQREQAERELRRNTELLDLVMENLPVGVFVFASDGQILRLNEAARRIWGCEHKVGPAQYGDYKAWWPDTGRPVEPHEWPGSRALSRGERVLDDVVEIEAFDGTRKTARVSGVPLRNGDVTVGAVAMIEDVTEQAAAQQALEDSEARYRAVVETAVDAMVIIDEKGAVLSFNRAAEHIFGYKADEVLGRNVSLLMPEPHQDAHDGYIMSYLRTGERRIIGIGREVEGRHRDGQPIPLELSIAEWRAGGRRFFTGIMRDVTRRRDAERRLKENLDLLETIIESSPDPVYVKDAGGRYLVVNSAAAMVLGRPRNHLVGVHLRDLASPEECARLLGNDRRIMAMGYAENVEEILFSKGHGGLRHYLSTKTPLRDATGEVVGIIGISRDITERKAMEDEFRRAKEEAEHANRAKSKFLAAASHDLRQPMQSLMLFSAALAPSVQDERGRKTLTLLERGLDTLKALLDSLLDVSRLDAGIIHPEIGTVALGQIVADIEAAYAPVARAKGLALRVERFSGVAVRSDQMLLGRMLRNMVENAVRYTERGEVVIGCAVADGLVRIEVADTGIGIPPDQLERIFEEFHQVGNVARDRSHGLGLGLAIVRRLSKLLDHPVWVRSELGKGSVFSVEVPLGLAEEAFSAQPCAPVEAVRPGLLALVVDDDAMVLMGLRTVLEGWGYDVLIAGSGDEALEGLAQTDRTPDVVIADYRLREGEVGTEVVRRVRAHIGRAVPGVLLTGETGSEFHGEAAASDLGLVHKPVTPRQLHGVIERQLRAAE